jgi:NAD(P)-dependent dehydrogenase (short-subunit alcohol dehydrogenase family)
VTETTNQIISAIAEGKNRLDGLVAAAGVNHIGSAIANSTADIERVISINYTGAFTSATAAAAQMLNKKSRGSILLVSSMSGLIANKGMTSSIYNSSKAAVIQLTRSFAMERSNMDQEVRGGIRVNCLCPGHIMTPMAQMAMDKTPGTKEVWESENMMGLVGTAGRIPWNYLAPHEQRKQLHDWEYSNSRWRAYSMVKASV